MYPPSPRCGKNQIDWADSPVQVCPHILLLAISVLMVHNLASREAQVRSLCRLPTGDCCGVASRVRSSALPQVKAAPRSSAQKVKRCSRGWVEGAKTE